MRVTIFPNWPAKQLHGRPWVEPSLCHIVDPLARAVASVVIAAPLANDGFPGIYGPLGNPAVRLRPLGRVDGHYARARRAAAYLRQLPAIAHAVRDSDFCYIFTPGHVGLLATLFCWWLRRPYGLYLRGDWGVAVPRWPWLHRRVLRRARFVLCVSADEVRRSGRLNPHCIFEAPLSPLLRAPLPERRPRGVDEPVTLLFVGQAIRDKGIFDLLDALAYLVNQHGLPARLLLVGEGAGRVELEQAAHARALAGHVRCAGLVTDPGQLAALYRQGDIFCLPTYYPEGFPRVLYEAMRFSLPIVTTAVGQIPTLLEHGRNALFHPPRDPRALTDCLAPLVRDPALRAGLGAAGRATLEPLLDAWQGQSHGDQVVARLRTEG